MGNLKNRWKALDDELSRGVSSPTRKAELRDTRRKTLADAQSEFEKISKDRDIQHFFKEASAKIKSQQLRTAIVRAAAFVGISIVAGAVAEFAAAGMAGMLIDASAGATQIAELGFAAQATKFMTRALVDSGVNAAGQSALTGQSITESFEQNLIMTLASSAVFGSFARYAVQEKQLNGVADELLQSFAQKHAGKLGKASEFLKSAGAIGVHTIWGAAMAEVAGRITTGKHQPSASTMEDWAIQGASVALGRHISSRMVANKKLHKEIDEAIKQTDRGLAEKAARLQQLAEKVVASKRGDMALELLDEHEKFMRQQIEGIERAVVRKGDPSGELALHRDATEIAIHESRSAGMLDTKFALIGLKELVPGALWKGTRVDIDRAIAQAESDGHHPKVLSAPNATRHRVQLGERIIEIEEIKQEQAQTSTDSLTWPKQVPADGTHTTERSTKLAVKHEDSTRPDVHEEVATTSSDTASRVNAPRHTATIESDHPAIKQLGALPPEVMVGTHHIARAQHALEPLPANEYAEFTKVVATAHDPVAKGFLYKAIGAGNSLTDVKWLAGEMAGKDRGWLIDNLTLGDPRGVGGGVKQQWSTSCNAAVTITLRGNYDPVFALRLRHRNVEVGNAHDSDPNAMNMNQADLEKHMLESSYEGSHAGSPKAHHGAATPRVSQGVGRFADDLLNAQSSATGMSFKSVEHPSGHEVVALLDKSLAAGMQVPLVVGDMSAPQAHYVLVQSRRTVAGYVEYNVHDPWTGESTWIKASDIANESIPGAYHKVGTVEVPTAIPSATARQSSTPKAASEKATTDQLPHASEETSRPQPHGAVETIRPIPSKTTDLDTFVGEAPQFADRMAKSVDPAKASAVRDVEVRALVSDAQVEAGLRIMDPVFGKQASNAFKEVAKSGDEQMISAIELARDHAMQTMLTTLRDPSLNVAARRQALVAELTRYETALNAHPQLDRSAINFAQARAQALTLSERSFSDLLTVDENGALSHAGKSAGTLPELMQTVKAANAAYRERKVAREFVIAITQPSDPKVPREVKILSRVPKQTTAASSSQLIEPLSNVDGVVVDIGVGLGSFARDAAQEKGALVQTEYGPKYADAAMTRRDLTWEHTGPRTDIDSVLVLGDTLQTLAMMFPERSVKRLFINNINAHYAAGSSEYQQLATGLRKVMAEGGRVEVQWTDDLETTGGKTSSRGHVTGTELQRALETTAGDVPRKVNVEEAPPVTDFKYSVEAPRTKTGIPSKTKPTDPVPKFHSVFTFGK